MKDYKQLLKELPSNTIVCALGEFNPPTVGHELLVNTVKVLAEQKGSDHVIYTSPSKNDLIQEEKKEHYLKLMFPTTKFKSLNESKFASVLQELNKKYKNVIVVAGAEQLSELKKLNVKVISINEKNPDANYTKMKQTATKGLYEEFKKKLPSTIRDIDGKRLMNDMRATLGLDPIKEQLVLVKDKLREQYFKGEIFNVGDIVESNGEQFEIVKRGSNHLLLKEQSGNLVSKWIQDVKSTEEKEMKEAVIQPNGTDKISTNTASTSDTGAKQDVKPKATTKGFLTFYNTNIKEASIAGKTPVKIASSKSDEDSDSQSDLDDQGQELQVYDPSEIGHTIVSGSDVKGSHHLRRMKIKHHLGESSLNPADIHGDYTAKSKALHDLSRDKNVDQQHVQQRKLDLEKEYALKKEKLKAEHEKNKQQLTKEEVQLEEAKKKKIDQSEKDTPMSDVSQATTFDPFFKEELTEEQIDEIVNSATDEDIEQLYEEDELTVVYDDTGEELPVLAEEAQIDLMEVLSRQERMKAKFRLRKTQAKRERTTKIALKRYSDTKTINKRARRLAIKLMKQRMLRGRNPAKISVGEKERLEKAIASRKSIVDRVAQKLVSRVRKVEKSRMSHGKATKGSMPSVF
jgi:phosphopantetheine adenylyltransferase